MKMIRKENWTNEKEKGGNKEMHIFLQKNLPTKTHNNNNNNNNNNNSNSDDDDDNDNDNDNNKDWVGGNNCYKINSNKLSYYYYY